VRNVGLKGLKSRLCDPKGKQTSDLRREQDAGPLRSSRRRYFFWHWF